MDLIQAIVFYVIRPDYKTQLQSNMHWSCTFLINAKQHESYQPNVLIILLRKAEGVSGLSSGSLHQRVEALMDGVIGPWLWLYFNCGRFRKQPYNMS